MIKEELQDKYTNLIKKGYLMFRVRFPNNTNVCIRTAKKFCNTFYGKRILKNYIH